VASSRNNNCNRNATIRVDVAVNNTKAFSVAMELQQGVSFELLPNNKILLAFFAEVIMLLIEQIFTDLCVFRTAVDNNKY
jgi:hypothetical protein